MSKQETSQHLSCYSSSRYSWRPFKSKDGIHVGSLHTNSFSRHYGNHCMQIWSFQKTYITCYLVVEDENQSCVLRKGDSGNKASTSYFQADLKLLMGSQEDRQIFISERAGPTCFLTQMTNHFSPSPVTQTIHLLAAPSPSLYSVCIVAPTDT